MHTGARSVVWGALREETSARKVITKDDLKIMRGLAGPGPTPVLATSSLEVGQGFRCILCHPLMGLHHRRARQVGSSTESMSVLTKKI